MPTHMMKKTSKIMHDWLPAVMHMWAHITGIQQCYNCPHDDETLDHLFHCANAPTLRSKQEDDKILMHLVGEESSQT